MEKGERHALTARTAPASVLFNLTALFRHLIDRVHESAFGRGIEVNRRGLSRSFHMTNLFHQLTVLRTCAPLWTLGYRYAFWRHVERLDVQ